MSVFYRLLQLKTGGDFHLSTLAQASIANKLVLWL